MGGQRFACNKEVCGGVGEQRCEHTTTCHSLDIGIVPDVACNILTQEMRISVYTSTIDSAYDVIVGAPVGRQYDLYTLLNPTFMRGDIQTYDGYTHHRPNGETHANDQTQSKETVARTSDRGGGATARATLPLPSLAGDDDPPAGMKNGKQENLENEPCASYGKL